MRINVGGQLENAFESVSRLATGYLWNRPIVVCREILSDVRKDVADLIHRLHCSGCRLYENR